MLFHPAESWKYKLARSVDYSNVFWLFVKVNFNSFKKKAGNCPKIRGRIFPTGFFPTKFPPVYNQKKRKSSNVNFYKRGWARNCMCINSYNIDRGRQARTIGRGHVLVCIEEVVVGRPLLAACPWGLPHTLKFSHLATLFKIWFINYLMRYLPPCPATGHLPKSYNPSGRWTSRSVKTEPPFFFGGVKNGGHKKKVPCFYIEQ